VAQPDQGERGASLVEMAFVAPLVILLLLGMVEFGYLFGQYNEVRHSAREGARVAAVSNEDLDQDADGDFDTTDIVLYACSVLNLATSGASVSVTKTGSDIGDTGTVTVTVVTPSLSGAPIISSFVPPNVANTATFVIEQPSTWSATSTPASC